MHQAYSKFPKIFFGAKGRVSTLLLGFFLPPDQIGIYRVAIQISVLATFGIQAMSMVVPPRFAKLYAENDKAGLENLVVKSARVTFVFNLLVFIAGVIFGRYFLELFYGTEFVPAYGPILILLAGQLFSSSDGLAGGHEIRLFTGNNCLFTFL